MPIRLPSSVLWNIGVKSKSVIFGSFRLQEYLADVPTYNRIGAMLFAGGAGT